MGVVFVHATQLCENRIIHKACQTANWLLHPGSNKEQPYMVMVISYYVAFTSETGLREQYGVLFFFQFSNISTAFFRYAANEQNKYQGIELLLKEQSEHF